ncbi:MAG: hypothetical protein OEQ74_00110 [Gammaproteobacteria bacterium]|nr:hypothetical protein [Gammaproteobacteria bacterium]
MSSRFENDLKNSLAASSRQVNQRTRDELARRRRLVLDTAETKTTSGTWLWLPAGVAVAALAAFLVVQPMTDGRSLPVVVAGEGEFDMDIMLAEESLELYEDLEFYEWLEVAGDAG